MANNRHLMIPLQRNQQSLPPRLHLLLLKQLWQLRQRLKHGLLLSRGSPRSPRTIVPPRLPRRHLLPRMQTQWLKLRHNRQRTCVRHRRLVPILHHRCRASPLTVDGCARHTSTVRGA